jgi:hypothetical protein
MIPPWHGNHAFSTLGLYTMSHISHISFRKDIFCLREERVTNAYRKISFGGMELKVPGVNPYEKVKLRMIPDEGTGLAEIRFWYKDNLVGTQKIKNTLLKRVHF